MPRAHSATPRPERARCYHSNHIARVPNEPSHHPTPQLRHTSAKPIQMRLGRSKSGGERCQCISGAWNRERRAVANSSLMTGVVELCGPTRHRRGPRTLSRGAGACAEVQHEHNSRHDSPRGRQPGVVALQLPEGRRRAACPRGGTRARVAAATRREGGGQGLPEARPGDGQLPRERGADAQAQGGCQGPHPNWWFPGCARAALAVGPSNCPQAPFNGGRQLSHAGFGPGRTSDGILSAHQPA